MVKKCRECPHCDSESEPKCDKYGHKARTFDELFSKCKKDDEWGKQCLRLINPHYYYFGQSKVLK